MHQMYTPSSFVACFCSFATQTACHQAVVSVPAVVCPCTKLSFSCSLIEAECYFETDQPSRLQIKARGQNTITYRLQHMLSHTKGPDVNFHMVVFVKHNCRVLSVCRVTLLVATQVNQR